MNLHQLDENLWSFSDTSNAYILRDGDAALLIDCGNGEVLQALAALGVARIEWVLFTHHHREVCQGAAQIRARFPEVRFAAPAAERAFFETPQQFRKMAPSLSDPFSCYGSSYLRPPREPIAIDHTFTRMDVFAWRGQEFWCLETPGNSPGAMSYLLRRDADWLAFSGDVMWHEARLPTWFDCEWDYGYGAGLDAHYISAFKLERFVPQRLFPARGPVIENPVPQLRAFRHKLKSITPLFLRGWDMRHRTEAADVVSQPSAVPHLWQITPHLFKFTGADFGGNFQMILSDSGHALFIDCGGWGSDWLDARLAEMQARLGLKQIDAVIVTHMHGDHLLDCEHLRQQHGAQLWTLDLVRETCEHGERFDYTCPINAYAGQQPVAIDRTFARGEILHWQGFDLTFDWLPGQTEFALILYGEIDNRLVAFTGDNIFRSEDDSGHDAVIARNGGLLERGYLYTAQYLSKLQPDLILAGHSVVIENPREQLQRFEQWAQQFRTALQGLSPDADYQYFFDPFWVRAYPYRSSVAAGATATFELIVSNYRNVAESHSITIQAPPGWTATPHVVQGETAAQGECKYAVSVQTPADAAPGVHLVTFDITRNGERYGELFDAIIYVEEPS